MAIGNKLLEKYTPVVRLNGGTTTKLPVVLSGTSATLAVGGTLTVTGASTFTGVSTFTAAPAGLKAPVVNLTAATVTLAASASGTVYTFDKADGVVVTLPAPSVGIEYTFVVKTTITSNSYKVITDAGTTFVMGSILGSVDNTAVKVWVGNGTSHISVIQSAASTNALGGIIGSSITFTCVTSTLWVVTGFTVAGGTPATPFSAT